MLRVVTRNSVYTVRVENGGFEIRRIADLWGREVKDHHAHWSAALSLAVGAPMVTDELKTTAVAAIYGYEYAPARMPVRDNVSARIR